MAPPKDDQTASTAGAAVAAGGEPAPGAVDTPRAAAPPSSARELRLELNVWGELSDPVLEDQYREGVLPAEKKLLRRMAVVAILWGLLNIGSIAHDFASGSPSPVGVAVTSSALALVVVCAIGYRMLPHLSWRASWRIVVAALFLLVVLITVWGIAVAEANDVETAYAFQRGNVFAVSVIVAMAPMTGMRAIVALATVPVIGMVILASRWAQTTLDIFFVFFIFLVAHSQQISRRRTFHLLRELRGENIVLKLKRESPATALARFFAGPGPGDRAVRGRPGKASVAPAQPWLCDCAEIEWTDKTLGRGAFGEVRLAHWRGSEVAVKELRSTSHGLDDFVDEVALLAQLRHPHVVLFMGVAMAPPSLYLVTEYVERGALSEIIHNPSVPLTQRMILQFAIETARGMQYLHSNVPPIIHRDLKPANLLVSSSNQIKISDFGMSRPSASGRLEGTLAYMSPEVLLREEYNAAPRDVYAFGVLLGEIFAREEPYADIEVSLETFMFRIVTCGLRPNLDAFAIPPEIVDLVSVCWAQKPSDRPTFHEIQDMLKGCAASIPEGHQSSTSSEVLSLQVPLPAPTFALAIELEGMLALWSRDPPRAKALCAHFNAALRKDLRVSRGFEILAEGGSMLAVFERGDAVVGFVDRAIGTVESSEAMQADGIWRTLRVSVHQGEIDLETHGGLGPFEYTGAAVDAARDSIEARAAGELFVSDEATTSVASQWPERTLEPCEGGSRCPLFGHDASSGRDMALAVDRPNGQPQLSVLSRRPFPWLVAGAELELGPAIGMGQTGEVFRARRGDAAVVVKRLHARRLKETARLEFLEQMGVAFKLRHDHIVAVVGACVPPDGFCIVSEDVGDSLRQVLASGVKMDARRGLREIGRGLRFLHGRLVLHLALTSHNVIVRRTDGALSVCDFGFSRARGDTMTMTKRTTFAWRAPEILGGECGTSASDVYSAGVIGWEMATGKEPFEDARETTIEMIRAIMAGKRPDCHGNEDPAMEVVRRCWAGEPAARLGVDDLCGDGNSARD